MQVRICEMVDVEATVTISAEAILDEFRARFDEAEEAGECPVKFAFLPLVDFATKLLARIPSKAMIACKDSQRAEVVKRLQAEADRWNEIYVTAE